MRQLLNGPLIKIGIILLNTDPGCRLHAILVFYGNGETRQSITSSTLRTHNIGNSVHRSYKGRGNIMKSIVIRGID